VETVSKRILIKSINIELQAVDIVEKYALEK
jgi:hypothetical protein